MDERQAREEAKWAIRRDDLDKLIRISSDFPAVGRESLYRLHRMGRKLTFAVGAKPTRYMMARRCQFGVWYSHRISSVAWYAHGTWRTDEPFVFPLLWDRDKHNAFARLMVRERLNILLKEPEQKRLVLEALDQPASSERHALPPMMIDPRQAKTDSELSTYIRQCLATSRTKELVQLCLVHRGDDIVIDFVYEWEEAMLEIMTGVRDV